VAELRGAEITGGIGALTEENGGFYMLNNGYSSAYWFV
jgi:hypothetical protein